jgi:glutamate-5-semialdehyde dehydrogenase
MDALKISPSVTIRNMGLAAKKAASLIAQTPTAQINKTLEDIAGSLIEQSAILVEINQKDLSAAKEKDLAPALIDRLTLTPERIQDISASVQKIIKLDDPVGETLDSTTRPNGLTIDKVSVPIGVLGMIYESRPNVTIDAAALCLKSHNAVILRGGSESFHTSRALHALIQDCLQLNNLPESAVSMMPSTDRALVGEMLKAHEFIDVIIPRGGKGLTGRVMSEATMPVFAHLDGNCHIYVHESANPNMALEIIKNAKLRRTGICGAAESLLFDKNFDPTPILTMLLDNDCIIVGDEDIQKLDDRIQPASIEDWGTEYLDNKISAKYVNSPQDAINHINLHGSHHTDAILSDDDQTTMQFQNQVDSAIVMHNTSTQFADGGEFGMGAEIGIGTGKLHARGPVGLKQLTTFKYLVKGTGQTRA